MLFLSRYSKTAKHQDCLHLSVRTSSSVPSCSGCDGLWLNSKPGVHDVRECSVSPVSPQDKLDRTAHFQNALLSRPDCCLASVKPSTLYKLRSATYIRFYSVCFFYYMLCLFFHSQLWGHKGKKIIMCEDSKKKFFLKERHFSEFMNVSHYFWHLIQF